VGAIVVRERRQGKAERERGVGGVGELDPVQEISYLAFGLACLDVEIDADETR
jgi:hypothetical protein